MSHGKSADLLHSRVSEVIIKTFLQIYDNLGYGFLESVYRRALAVELGSTVSTLLRNPQSGFHYRGVQIGHFRSDLLVNNQVMIELKVAKELHSRHSLQLHNALRASRIELGLLLNFGPKPEFKRIILMNRNKPQLEAPP